MQFPSVDLLVRAARGAAVRFPLVVLAAVAAAVAAGILVERDGEAEFAESLLAAATLGLPLFLALDVIAERRSWRGTHRLGLWAAGLIVLAGVGLAWPTWSEPAQGRRYLQLSTGFHLAVAVLPYMWGRELRGFWEYNRQLAGRALLAATYAVLLFGGLALAVGALDRLLGVPIPDRLYAHLWLWSAFVFTTVFFLAGVPEDFAALESRTDYPRWLETFAQYMLMPIVVVYLAILTAYFAKVVITTEWPSGWIGYLVSSVAILGVLSLLLLHPIAVRAENRWVATYARWFYVGLVPAIVMLLLSIAKRVEQYGVTENRYFLVVASLWLAGIAVYYGVTRSRNIRLIPATLGALALLTLAGPWSAYSWSERSQVGRLRGLFEANGLWRDGGVERTERDVPLDERRQMSAVLDYLGQTHGLGAVAEWFPDSVVDAPSAYPHTAQRTRALLEGIGVGYVTWQGVGEAGRTVRYDARTPFLFEALGYDRSVFLDTGLDSLEIDGLTLVVDSLARVVRLGRGGIGPLAFSLDSLVAQVDDAAGDTTRPPIVLSAEADSLRARLVLQYVSAEVRRDSTIVIRMLRGVLLVGR